MHGPIPNKIGNLCIAGHNYVDNKLFSNLYKLDYNDLIKIFDLNGNEVIYRIYSINEINIDDLSCMDQNTNNNIEITLITCNNVNGKRLCIKAIEK